MSTVENNSPRPAAVVRSEADRKPAQRTRPSSTGGMRLKLQVFGEIPGYKLYWENDEDAAIEQLLHEGFEFVTPEEVQMASWIVQDADIANKVSKYVGKRADGSPLRAYLLKCPEDMWNERQAMGQEQANTWDDAIRAGTVGSVDSRYKPKGADISLNTNR